MSTHTLELWVVYDSPADYPGQYVARCWLVDAKGPHPTVLTVAAPTLQGVRDQLPRSGLTRHGRYVQDDPCIVEVWM